MDRRQMISRSALAAGGVAVGAAFGAPACDKPSVEVEVSTAITFLKKVGVLIPGQSTIVGKIITALDDFNRDYQKGDFNSASSLFENVDADFSQLVTDLGATIPPSVKIALALVDAAISAIAVLLKAKAPATLTRATLTGRQVGGAEAVERRAAHAEKLFAAIRK